MINTEYIRSLNANYERMALGEKPEEKGARKRESAG